MTLKEAIDLISGIEGIQTPGQYWADLGSGDGLFTKALANLLGNQSSFHAIDLNEKSLAKIPQEEAGIPINKIKADFINDELPLKGLDGILMANSLHFIKNKSEFLTKASKWLKPEHRFLIVEYDLRNPNPWVPYPLNFDSLKLLFEEQGYTSIRKLHERPSAYNRANMYAAIISKEIK